MRAYWKLSFSYNVMLHVCILELLELRVYAVTPSKILNISTNWGIIGIENLYTHTQFFYISISKISRNMCVCIYVYTYLQKICQERIYVYLITLYVLPLLKS